MKKNKILTTLFITFLLICCSTLAVFAQDSVGGDGAKSDMGGAKQAPSNIFTLQNPLNKNINSVGGLIQAVLEIITYLFIIFAVLMFIYVGFQYVTNAAQGNAKKIEELHHQLKWLVVGVAVVIGARVIIQVVINTIAATNTVSPSVIESANRAAQGR
jgi:hypothetical protein